MLKLQQLRTKSLTQLAVFVGRLGSEVTYSAVIPFIYWNVNMAVARKLVMLWAFGSVPSFVFQNHAVPSDDSAGFMSATILRTCYCYHGHTM